MLCSKRLQYALIAAVTGLVSAGAANGAEMGDSADSGRKEASGGGQAATDVPPTAVPAAGESTLKGTVRGSALLTEDGLKKLGETTGRVRKWALGMMGEVTRQETIAVRGPNVLPGGVVIPAFPSPSGTAAVGPALPPRPGIVRNLMRELGYQIQLLRNEVDALIIPPGKMPLIQKDWDEIRKNLSMIEIRYARLQGLTRTPPIDNEKVGKEALVIYDDAGKINKLRKKVTRTVQAP